MNNKISDLAGRARKEYSEEGLASLITNSVRFVGESVSPYHGRGYTKEYGENVFPYPAPETTVQLHASGLGDLMIVRQFGRAIQDYYREFGDPEFGDVVIAAGAMDPAFDPDPGDINLYWWWSFGRLDDEPDQYLNHYLKETAVEPDAILCPSERCLREAEQLGYDTLFLPLGTYAFEPLGFERRGLGYAGTKNHKQSEKEARVLGPFGDDEDFEWVSHFVFPEQLNQWYNRKLVTFGLHKEGQRQWGMVNNRVFETLASGTPFVLEAHPVVDDILGFDFPYQTDSRDKTVELVNEIRNSPRDTVAEFQEYSEHVRENHSYNDRVTKLFEFLS